MTVLQAAVEIGQLSVVQLLLHHGADVSLKCYVRLKQSVIACSRLLTLLTSNWFIPTVALPRTLFRNDARSAVIGNSPA